MIVRRLPSCLGLRESTIYLGQLVQDGAEGLCGRIGLSTVGWLVVHGRGFEGRSGAGLRAIWGSERGNGDWDWRGSEETEGFGRSVLIDRSD